VLSHPVLQLLKALQGIRGEQQRNNTALYYTMTARDTQQRDISTSTLTSHLHVYLALQSDFRSAGLCHLAELLLPCNLTMR
jgi:hypothetical protein